MANLGRKPLRGLRVSCLMSFGVASIWGFSSEVPQAFRFAVWADLKVRTPPE